MHLIIKPNRIHYFIIHSKTDYNEYNKNRVVIQLWIIIDNILADKYGPKVNDGWHCMYLYRATDRVLQFKVARSGRLPWIREIFKNKIFVVKNYNGTKLIIERELWGKFQINYIFKCIS